MLFLHLFLHGHCVLTYWHAIPEQLFNALAKRTLFSSRVMWTSHCWPVGHLCWCQGTSFCYTRYWKSTSIQLLRIYWITVVESIIYRWKSQLLTIPMRCFYAVISKHVVSYFKMCFCPWLCAKIFPCVRQAKSCKTTCSTLGLSIKLFILPHFWQYSPEL